MNNDIDNDLQKPDEVIKYYQLFKLAVALFRKIKEFFRK